MRNYHPSPDKRTSGSVGPAAAVLVDGWTGAVNERWMKSAIRTVGGSMIATLPPGVIFGQAAANVKKVSNGRLKGNTP